MITINQIATELENILNGTSTNVGSVTRPIQGLFAVRTEGYHLDNVHDYETGRNFFPVFIGSFNGEINPIPNVYQYDLEIPVSIYFPVRFKSKMLEMVTYLVQVFAGKGIKFLATGSTSIIQETAFSNISYPDLGEITDLDLDQFGNSILKGLNEFIQEQYKMPVSSSEPWICLNFSWYLTGSRYAMKNSQNGAIYGTAYNVGLIYGVYNINAQTSGITFAYGAQTESQQGFAISSGVADTESKSLAVTNATSITFEAVVTRDVFWRDIMKAVANGTLDPNGFRLKLILKDEYRSLGADGQEYAEYMTEYRKVVLTEFTTSININQIVTARMTFTPKAEVSE